jgi:hypothetical protein
VVLQSTTRNSTGVCWRMKKTLIYVAANLCMGTRK